MKKPYLQEGLLGKAMQHAQDGDLVRCIFELEKIRKSGWGPAAFQLAAFEYALNNQYYKECGYYYERLKEAADLGHLNAKFNLSKFEVVNGKAPLFQSICKIIRIYKERKNRERDPKIWEFWPLNIGEITPEIARSKEIWIGHFECINLDDPESILFYSTVSFRAANKEEFDSVAGFYVRRLGLKILSMLWSEELHHTYDTGVITKDDLEDVYFQLGTPDKLKNDYAVL